MPRIVDADYFQRVKESEACRILAEDARLIHRHQSLATMAAPDFQCCSKVIMLCQSSTLLVIEICEKPVKSTIRTESVVFADMRCKDVQKMLKCSFCGVWPQDIA